MKSFKLMILENLWWLGKYSQYKVLHMSYEFDYVIGIIFFPSLGYNTWFCSKISKFNSKSPSLFLNSFCSLYDYSHGALILPLDPSKMLPLRLETYIVAVLLMLVVPETPSVLLLYLSCWRFGSHAWYNLKVPPEWITFWVSLETLLITTDSNESR